MKLIIDTNEFAAILDGTGVTEEVKKKVAGLIVSMAQTPIMTQAIEEIIEARVGKRVDERMKQALDSALTVTNSGYYTSSRVEGWAAAILNEKITRELNMTNTVKGLVTNMFDNYVRNAVAQENASELNAVTTRAVKAVRETVTEEYVESVIKRVADTEFKKAVQAEVQIALGRILKGGIDNG